MAFGAPKMGMGLGTAMPSVPSVKPIARVPSVGLHSAPKIGMPKMPHLASGGSLASNNIPGIPTNQTMSEDPYHGGGLFTGGSGGRTDTLPRAVPADSFVVPADVISGLGQGSTMAGSKIMDGILTSGPFGTALPRGKRADGGNSSDGGLSHVLVADGEYLVPRDKVAELGRRMRQGKKSRARSDLAAGHESLRAMVDKVRKHQKKFLATAPKPKA